MVVVRQWEPRDRAGVAGLDTSFTTEVIYEVGSEGKCFCLNEVRLESPITKTYAVEEPEDLAGAFVAEVDGRIVGYAVLSVESWNGRGNIHHLYVTRSHRWQGIGAALLHKIGEVARRLGARTLWVETQNLNYPATEFYRHVGFQLTGFDRTLYGPASNSGEVALFYSRDL